MKTVFLSDAHLSSQKSSGYEKLLVFFDSIANTVDHVVIVGDFFDFWFCDNHSIYAEFRAITEKLLELRRKGIEITFFEGNHDFFLGDYFGQYDITVFPDSGVINLDEKKVFVAHGDLIDKSNGPYLRLRCFLRSRFFYHLQKILPASLLWKLSKISSRASKKHLARPPYGLGKKMEVFAMEKFKEGFDAVVLGHYHEPIFKEYVIDGNKKTFAVLGDWISHFTYLAWDNGNISLNRY